MVGAYPRVDPIAIQGFKQMMNMVSSAGDPQAILSQLMARNPQINSVIQMLNGRNPKDVFYEQCQQHGIDPESVLSQLR